MLEEKNNNAGSLNTTKDQTNTTPSIETQNENLSSQSPNRPKIKIFAFIGTVIAVCIIVVTGVVLYLKQQKLPESSKIAISTTDNITKTPTKESEDNLEPPELYPELEWEEFVEGKDNKSLGQNGLYSQKDVVGFISMSGQEWTASKDNLDNEAMIILIRDFEEYYDNKLTQQRWDTLYKDDLYNFVPLSADGPSGNIWGYTKVGKNKLRLILLEINKPPEAFGEPVSCPCSVGLRVFVSEIESLGELIKRVEK
ncbi:hypothetical protein A2159_02230 [Candidatus Woesebacteria bacterium RBG_13_34_9]|uniref:Uncharacterized protein n=1 Tax=Candidatus Woesebacteria bacterium RBG_13_34_9 TaxID=1802477 RepID=A0A1F7X0M9_9BACT|nr:MAG: hypothetical protein A2159_02230 [Candidatus Woesebacteria bacterium RBG_13_34_9]